MKTLCNLAFASAVAFSVGCFQATSKPTADVATSKPTADVATSGATAEEATPRETMNKTTQNVLNLDQAMTDGGVLAATNIPSADPLTQSAAAYRTTVGKIGAMAVHQAIQIRDAQSIKDPKPLSYDELMKEIIRNDQPDGIQLAMLPYYQEYAWDAKSQTLVVVDFPARKEERQKQLDGN